MSELLTFDCCCVVVCLLPGPAIIDETVRVAKKYLEEHPEETGGSMEPGSKRSISSFLNWPESRVGYSLERLNLEKSGMVNREMRKAT